MADLKETTAAGVQVSRAASNPHDVIRKQEFDAAVEARPTAAEVNAAIAAVTHAAVTVADSNSINLTLSGQQVSGDLKLVADSEVQAAGNSYAIFDSVTYAAPGTTLTLGKNEVTVTQVQTFTPEGVLIDTMVDGVDYEVNSAPGTIYVPNGTALAPAESGEYFRVDFTWAQVNEGAGLEIGAGGTGVKWGDGYNEVPRGSHTHPNDHHPVTPAACDTTTITVSESQVIDVEVKLKAGGKLEADGDSGIDVKANAFAATSHSHSNATSGAAGFMSAADKVKLDSLEGGAEAYQDTDTIGWNNSSYVSADVRYGAGLSATTGGLQVDFTQVSAVGHTHPPASSSTSGLMTPAQVQALNAATYIYLAWADSVSSGVPVNFSLAKDANKTCLAILASSVAITTPVAADFSGLWLQITPA